MSKKSPMTTKEFVQRAAHKHNNRYDYSDTTYVHYKNPVAITCPTHGLFTQNPMRHLRGNGCPLCAREQDAVHKTKSYADVIQSFREVHGDLYDYTNMKYTGTHHKIEIVCPKHGPFYQQPNDHVHGTGCPKCAKLRQTTSIHEFVSTAKTVHGDKYNYSKSTYINNSTNVEIICPVHGSFFQLPLNHISRGSGCAECAAEQRGLGLRLSQKEFITRAVGVHNNKYDYSTVVYTGNQHKVEIICPDHGSFFQKAGNHLNLEQGCPKCSQYIGAYTEHLFNTKPELKDANALVYFIEFKKNDEVFQKIGITQRTVAKRFQAKKGYQIISRYEKAITLYAAFKLEQHILKRWRDRKYQPLTTIGGDSECFNLSDEECLEIIQLLRIANT